MSVSHFVSGSALFLASWLLVTFLREVPVGNYPTLGRGSVPISAQAQSTPAAEIATTAATPDAPAQSPAPLR